MFSLHSEIVPDSEFEDNVSESADTVVEGVLNPDFPFPWLTNYKGDFFWMSLVFM